MIRFVMSLTVLLAAGTATVARADGPDAKKMIENDQVSVSVDTDKGSFTVEARQKPFVARGKLKEGGKAAVRAVKNAVFGPGEEIEVAHADGHAEHFRLHQGLPFVLFRTTLANKEEDAITLNHVETVNVRIDLPLETSRLRTLGTGGLATPPTNPGSYSFLAVAEPYSRGGVVGAWLTQDRGSGVVFTEEDNGQVRLKARLDYGRLRLAPGATAESETFALGYFQDTRLGLEAWADAVARVHHIHLPPEPTGYCTWYHAHASDAKHLIEQARLAVKDLVPYGFQFVQIDDGWQAGTKRNGPAKNFTTHKANGPYPAGMKATADELKALGLRPGIWFMPFAGDHLDPAFKDHPDWFVKKADGSPYETRWGGTCLDMTNPDVQAYVRSVAHRIAHDWGYTYFKMDGLWTGSATPLAYVNSGYKDDGIGDAIFHDPNKTNIEAYRDGLKLVREAAGKDVFFLGCCAPQNMRSLGGAFGLVDAMRVGPDNKTDWDHLVNGPVFGSRMYFLHGRVWYNDPDPVYVRASLPLEHARVICSWVTITGQLNVSSDAYADLPAERLDLLRRTMPYHGLKARPVDLFEHDPPRIWVLTDERRKPRRDVIAVFNWDAKHALEVHEPLARLGLDDGREYVAFDFWENKLLPPLKRKLEVTLPAQSCKVLAVRPMLDHPQVISTSRHITQGMVDIVHSTLEPLSQTLEGSSRVVGGDSYELRIVCDTPRMIWTPMKGEVSEADQKAGVRISIKAHEGLVRAVIESPESREVQWRIWFKRPTFR